MNRSDAVDRLRQVVQSLRPGVEVFDQIIEGRDSVFARFQPVFSLGHIDQLTREEYIPFLYLENNRHWSGLYRQGLRTAEDMPRLRNCLRVLLDEARPIAERFTEALSLVDGLGKGIATALLTVAYPGRYGVWNNTSESGLKMLGLWPGFGKGLGLGGRYERVNDELLKLAAELGVDLWTLDAVWWVVIEGPSVLPVPLSAGTPAALAADHGLGSFGLEKQLEDFLIENWDRTSLGREWAIYSTEGEPLAGNQFPTEVGPIDILARHRKESRWLILELKRNQTSDQTIGQTLRYTAWVQKNLAAPGESVEALIVAHRMDKQGAYALTCVPGVKAMLYEVEFRLREFDPETLISQAKE